MESALGAGGLKDDDFLALGVDYPYCVTSSGEVLLNLARGLANSIGWRKNLDSQIGSATRGSRAANALDAFLPNECYIGRENCSIVEPEPWVSADDLAEFILPHMLGQKKHDLDFVPPMIESWRRYSDQFPFVEFESHRIVVGHPRQIVSSQERLGGHVFMVHRCAEVVSPPPEAVNSAIIFAAAAGSSSLIASFTSSTRRPVASRPNAANFTQISVTTP